MWSISRSELNAPNSSQQKKLLAMRRSFRKFSKISLTAASGNYLSFHSQAHELSNISLIGCRII